MNTKEKNRGSGAMFSALNWLQEQCPDSEISFDMPWEQQLNVRRNGIRYSVKQISTGDSYKYAVGAELELEDLLGRQSSKMRYPVRANACDDYAEAVVLLAKVMLADPRQDDLFPWGEQPKDFTISFQAAKAD